MRARSRLLLYDIERWAIRVAVGFVLLWFAIYAYLALDTRTLAGLKVAGEALPRTHTAADLLQARALAWGANRVSMITGPNITVATRSELGASLDAKAMASRVAAVGHSGNPFFDVATWFQVTTEGRDLAWPARIDRMQLSRYVRAIRNRVERPPVAGTSDRDGGAIKGVAGVTLDTVAMEEQLERTLRRGGLKLEIGLREVAAPQAIAIGTPDGIDEREQPSEESGGPHGGANAQLSAADMARMQAAAPHAWLPGQGCEPMDPPYEHFCQGPRQVPQPFGDAAALAEQLDLGSLQTVGRLLNSGPRADWIAAAGGPVDRHVDMLWPVVSGRLWRRFGYVRHPPFEHLLHRGVDVGAPRGTPLHAVNPGIVAYSDNRVRGYGNLLVIVHDDGSVTFSAHCRAIYVFAGQRVQRGQIVGEVGDTGLARGTHVHWELHVQGQPVDPEGLFAAR